MKKIFLILIVFGIAAYAYGQLTIDSLKKVIKPYRLGYSYYFDSFVDKPGYGGPWILTNDGGGAAFGNNTLYKFDKTGKEQWNREVKAQYDEMESQCVAQDTKGNLYVFMISYNSKQYRGGAERVLCYNKSGKLLWDKTIGKYALVNNPTVSYVRQEKDGRIYMRGHVCKEVPPEGKDPEYRYWEGWIDSAGKLTQKAGEVIDWSKAEWQNKFKPE